MKNSSKITLRAESPSLFLEKSGRGKPCPKAVSRVSFLFPIFLGRSKKTLLAGYLKICELQVPLTPRNVFCLYKFPFSPDHHCEKIIVVAIFVNFLRIFKVYNFAHFHVHDRGVAENGTSWLLTSFRE